MSWHNHNSRPGVGNWNSGSEQIVKHSIKTVCVPAHNPAALCLCVFVCPLIVTLDCSKTATYWDGVGTAVAQAAYVMRHFFSLSLSPSISVCLHSEKIRWCRNAWDYREAWLRVCCSPGCGWERMRSVQGRMCEIPYFQNQVVSGLHEILVN